MKTVIEIVKSHLVGFGYDGLVNGAAECGCLLGDLAPCCDNINECKPGYRHDVSDSPGDWIVSTSRTPPTKD